MSGNRGNEAGHNFEHLDADQLAARLGNVSLDWIRRHSRATSRDMIPHIELGRAKRYRWNSPELNDWLSRRMSRNRRNS